MYFCICIGICVFVQDFLYCVLIWPGSGGLASGGQACVQIASFCVITRLRQELSALSRDKLDCLIPGLAYNKFDLNMSKVFVYFILVCLTYFCLDERVAMKTILYQNLAEVKMDWSIGFTRS